MELITNSTISNEFNGFDEDMLFKLDNGDVWIQDEYKYNYHYCYRPQVKILKDSYRFYLQVDGMDDKVAVRRLANYIESKIVSDFKGWNGKTIFEFSNGQTWQQSRYAYKYHYAYRPKAMIYDSGNGYKMNVEGMSDGIFVKRIK